VVVSTIPLNGEFYGGAGSSGVAAKPIAFISGTAQDLGATASGVQQVQVRIRDIAGSSNFWDGASFSISDPNDPSTFRAASGSGAGVVNWNYPAGAETIPGWVSGRTYRVNARAVDGGGNYSVALTTSDFLYDVNLPTSTLTVPAAAYL